MCFIHSSPKHNSWVVAAAVFFNYVNFTLDHYNLERIELTRFVWKQIFMINNDVTESTWSMICLRNNLETTAADVV